MNVARPSRQPRFEQHPCRGRRQLRRRAPPRFLFEAEVPERLPGGVLHDEARIVVLLDGPRWWEAAHGSDDSAIYALRRKRRSAIPRWPSLWATNDIWHGAKTANLFADHHNRTHRRAPNCGRFLWFSNCLRSELKPRAWRGFLFIEVKAEADSRLTHTSSVIVLWLLVGCSRTSLPWPSPLRL